MAVIERGNWSFRDPGNDIPSGSIINNGNFSQAVPDTVILAGKTLTINGGNFFNVRKDPSWTIVKANFSSKSLCSHLHPELVERGLLEPEIENCSHVVEVIEIAGGSDVYRYEDTKVQP